MILRRRLCIKNQMQLKSNAERQLTANHVNLPLKFCLLDSKMVKIYTDHKVKGYQDHYFNTVTSPFKYLVRPSESLTCARYTYTPGKTG